MVDTQSETDRPRGILSPADRAFLVKSEEERAQEYSRQARSKRKRAIRERVKQSVYDVTLLLDFWPSQERADLIEAVLEDWRGREGLADLIALFALELVPRDRFDELFGRGIYRAETRRSDDQQSGVISVQSYDDIVEYVERATIEGAIANYVAGERDVWEMSEAEIRVLVRLLDYQDFDESTLKSMLGNVDRAMYELAGARDSERRLDWRESLHQDRKHGQG